MQLGRKLLLATSIATIAITIAAGVAQARTDAPSDNVASKSTTVSPDGVEAKLGAARFAVVDFNGNLIRGKNVVDAEPLSSNPGRYEVIFDRDVTDCAYTATIGDEGAGDEISGIIDVASRNGKPNAVFVETSTLDDIPDLRDFHLVVTC